MPINGHVALPGDKLTCVDKSKIVNQFLKFSWLDDSEFKIGSLASISVTAKVQTSRLTGISLKQGPARVESDEKIQWGTLNKQAKWEGGVIEFDVERQEIVYRKYEKGVKVKDCFRKFDGFKWSKP